MEENRIGPRFWAPGFGLDALHLAGQDHDLPIIGFAPLLLRPTDWATIDQHLTDDPPHAIVVATAAYTDIERRSPSTQDVLVQHFCREPLRAGIDVWTPRTPNDC